MPRSEYQEIIVNSSKKDKDRDKLQEMLFGNGVNDYIADDVVYAEYKQENKKRNDLGNIKAIELEVFQVLKKRGYSQQETAASVSNFIQNINRLG